MDPPERRTGTTHEGGRLRPPNALSNSHYRQILYFPLGPFHTAEHVVFVGIPGRLQVYMPFAASIELQDRSAGSVNTLREAVPISHRFLQKYPASHTLHFN